MQELSETERLFISTVIQSLSFRYPLFKKELDLGTLLWVAPNRVGGEESFVFGINNNIWQKLCDTSKENFLIKNIFFKNYNNEKVIVELYTTEGLIVGFGATDKIENIDVSTIDISNIWEKYFLNNDYSEIKNVIDSLTKEQLCKLNMVKNTFKIEIGNTFYYPIHDFGNGNYLVINTAGVVFKISHDPLQLQKVCDTIAELLSQQRFP